MDEIKTEKSSAIRNHHCMLIAWTKIYLPPLAKKYIIPISREPAKIRIRIAGETKSNYRRSWVWEGADYPKGRIKFPDPTITGPIHVILLSGQPEGFQIRYDRYLKLQRKKLCLRGAWLSKRRRDAPQSYDPRSNPYNFNLWRTTSSPKSELSGQLVQMKK